MEVIKEKKRTIVAGVTFIIWKMGGVHFVVMGVFHVPLGGGCFDKMFFYL